MGQQLWLALGLEGRDLNEDLTYYPLGQGHEVSLLYGAALFDLRISPLSHVSLALEGYMLCLSNISCGVSQRESLAARLHERTVALQDSERLFGSLFKSAGDGILIGGHRSQYRGRQPAGGRDTRSKPPGPSLPGLSPAHRARTAQPSEAGDSLLGREPDLDGRIERPVGERESFPMEVTVNRVDMEERSLFHTLAYDITKHKAMEENLRQEKAQMEEVNVPCATS